MSRRDKIEEMLKSTPEDAFLIYSLAMEDVRDEQFERAISNFERTIQIESDHVASYFQLGQTLVKIGEEEKAIRILSEGIGVAQSIGDDHAAAEMQAFLETIS